MKKLRRLCSHCVLLMAILISLIGSELIPSSTGSAPTDEPILSALPEVSRKIHNMITYSTIQHQGPRSKQEDVVHANDYSLLVCDGMGGHPDGEVAAAAVASYFQPDVMTGSPAAMAEHLLDAFSDAQLAVDRLAANAFGARPGTTLTALWKTSGLVGLIHIGDCRAYLLSPDSVIQLTRDHGYGSVLEKCVLGGERYTPDLAFFEPTRPYGLLVASDGWYRQGNGERSLVWLHRALFQDHQAKVLVRMPMQPPILDNASAALVMVS